MTDPDGTHHVGEYVSGWIKRGPSGVIGTNKKDSQDTVTRSWRTWPPAASTSRSPTTSRASSRRARRTRSTWEGWQAINAIETAAGEASAPARPRVKLTEWAALREAAKLREERSCMT